MFIQSANRSYGLILASLWLAAAISGALAAQEFPGVPGIVIAHSPASSGIYIGSPSLSVLPDGRYVATHDEFGPKSTEGSRAVTRVFRSADSGRTWEKISTIEGQFWSTVFTHRGALYILGTENHHGNAIIRRSMDGGMTWTSPTNSTSGLLRNDGQYHCAPVPILEYRGRLWRGMERRLPPRGSGATLGAGMLSAPVDADLLNATNWVFCDFVPNDTNWLGGDFGGWLEGNAVAAPDGRVLDVLRVDTSGYPERAAVVEISADGRRASFNAQTGFVNFPGGAKKFTVRHDPKSNLYWALATLVPERHRSEGRPASVRNTLALISSPDLRTWEQRCILLYHPDTAKHGFQYVDWQFEGADIIAVCRTAHDDGEGRAHNHHDANFLTFHRWKSFRDLKMADSVAPFGKIARP